MLAPRLHPLPPLEVMKLRHAVLPDLVIAWPVVPAEPRPLLTVRHCHGVAPLPLAVPEEVHGRALPLVPLGGRAVALRGGRPSNRARRLVVPLPARVHREGEPELLLLGLVRAPHPDVQIAPAARPLRKPRIRLLEVVLVGLGRGDPVRSQPDVVGLGRLAHVMELHAHLASLFNPHRNEPVGPREEVERYARALAFRALHHRPLADAVVVPLHLYGRRDQPPRM
mmetsp:Transcript_44634/g.142114  ORF Transcript_44634/g.142114 Transcript_44634/m.142114 type:complete len:225 (+) Transcript_44634:525-1199(+)